MANEKINEIVAAAVGRKFEEWAMEHPSLAAVIDRIRLTDQAAQSLRSTEGYRHAVEAYHRDSSELNLLTQLVELVGPILVSIVGG
jgi:hypothetical protein